MRSTYLRDVALLVCNSLDATTTQRSARETLGIYLPATLVDHWTRHPEQPPLWGHWLTGSLMFCDISGFTAMSEELSAVGKEGAELMAGSRPVKWCKFLNAGSPLLPL